MHGEFDERLGPAGNRRETELTLGSMALLGIFFGIALFCGLFFALGFAVGRSGRNDAAAASQQTPAGVEASSAATGSRPKPSAAPQNSPEPQRTVVNLPYAASDTNTDPSPRDSGSAGVVGHSSGQPQVKAAVPPAANPPQPVPAPKVQPVTAPAAAIMVQIAAVSHQEDAEVLVSALRKRGYTVTARRQPSDSLIHVQIGPFTNRNDANAMRLKLLNDGYNAIVQP